MPRPTLEQRLIEIVREANGRVVPWETLLSELWGDQGESRAYLDKIVRKARDKGVPIGTVQGQGLIWMSKDVPE